MRFDDKTARVKRRQVDILAAIEPIENSNRNLTAENVHTSVPFAVYLPEKQLHNNIITTKRTPIEWIEFLPLPELERGERKQCEKYSVILLMKITVKLPTRLVENRINMAEQKHGRTKTRLSKKLKHYTRKAYNKTNSNEINQVQKTVLSMLRGLEECLP